MFIFTCAQLPGLAVSMLPVLGILAALGVLVQAVLACWCRVGVIRAVLGCGGQCRVEISGLACTCRVYPALTHNKNLHNAEQQGGAPGPYSRGGQLGPYCHRAHIRCSRIWGAIRVL